MNSSIFPIPPDFKWNNSEIFIRSSLTLANFPNNCLLENIKQIMPLDEIFYQIYALQNKSWEKIDSIKCAFGETIDISRKELNIDNDTLAIAIPSVNNDSSNRLRYLPSPYSLRIDNSPIAERASYNFKLVESLTSYQGEYPYKMSTNKSGSFFSTNLINDDTQNSSSYLLLVNIKNDAYESSKHKLIFYNASKKENKKIFEIKSNSFVVISLDFLKDSFNNNDEIFLSCNSETFLPIYINTNAINNHYEINVEHTHPPFENFWGRDRFEANKIIKNNWIK